jgi:hypothetical protein
MPVGAEKGGRISALHQYFAPQNTASHLRMAKGGGVNPLDGQRHSAAN